MSIQQDKTPDIRTKIEMKAHELFQARKEKGLPGNEHSDWIEAEQLVLTKRNIIPKKNGKFS